MKAGIKILTIYILSFIALNATCQQVTYSGPVEYKFIRTKKANGTGSKGYNWSVDINEKYTIEGTFYVVFTAIGLPGGFTMCQLTSIDEDIHFENSIKNEASEERISQGCSDEGSESTRIVSPGDSRIYKQAVKHVRLNPEKPCIGQGTLTITSPNSGGQKVPASGKYSVMLGGAIETDMTSEVYSEYKYACNPNRNAPPEVVSQNLRMSFPVSIIFEGDFDGSDVFKGRQVILDKHRTDCGPGSPYANMTHGKVDCAFDESIIVSWTLKKRARECIASISASKGNVKVNGAPAGNGNIKIAAGDMISTGGKSRIKINMPDGSYIAMGSNSRLILEDPCNLDSPTPKLSKRAWLNIYTGKFGIVPPPGFELKTGEVGGVRGQIIPPFREHFYVDNYNDEIRSGPYNDVHYEINEIDPEKESIIKDMGDLDKHELAFYIHSDSKGVYDVSAIKGALEVESAIRSEKMIVNEGTTVNSWPDGASFVEIYVREKQ